MIRAIQSLTLIMVLFLAACLTLPASRNQAKQDREKQTSTSPGSSGGFGGELGGGDDDDDDDDDNDDDGDDDDDDSSTRKDAPVCSLSATTSQYLLDETFSLRVSSQGEEECTYRVNGEDKNLDWNCDGRVSAGFDEIGITSTGTHEIEMRVQNSVGTQSCSLRFNVTSNRVRMILDTDANNELDDQHAIAYAVFNSDLFDIEGITTNRTQNGGGIQQHYDEARRVVYMCDSQDAIPVLRGADRNYVQIRGQLNNPNHDGHEAVDFIIERAKADPSRELVLVPVGKLTNIALAIEKDPSIIPNVRVLWLGGNWPNTGGYNLPADPESVNAVIDSRVELDIATVRFNQPSGTAAVTATIGEIRANMARKGPRISPAIPGRAGGFFNYFGDYSIDLYTRSGDSVRALYDVAAVALIKNPSWARRVEVPAPRVVGSDRWEARPLNPHRIGFYENFNRNAIIGDFFETMRNYSLP